jgi:hypothetical protein
MLTSMSPACVTEHGLAQPSCTCTFTTNYKHCTGDVIDRVLRSTVTFPVQKSTRNSHRTTTGDDNGSDGMYHSFEKRLLCLDEVQSAHIKLASPINLSQNLTHSVPPNTIALNLTRRHTVGIGFIWPSTVYALHRPCYTYKMLPG